MVGAGIISDVQSAIPIIMGSNIGTCVTNSFIALTLAGNPNEFKRAFAAATLNDGFNLLTTLVLLPIEIIFGVEAKISYLLSTAILPKDGSTVNVNFIGVIINPVTDLFIRLNNTAVNKIADGDMSVTLTALRCCGFSTVISPEMNSTLMANILTWPGYTTSSDFLSLDNVTVNNISYSGYLLINGTLNKNETFCQKCTYWCMPMLRSFGDAGTGLFWIILSIVVLIASLFSIVKVASLLISGPIAKGVNKALNASFPGKFAPLTEIVLFFVSFGLTLIVQSSNIVTATLVPLCGIGMITVDRVFVMTLGSNIGTTVTGILSAFTTPPSTLQKSLQLAFVYTLFNTLGTIMWLPIRILRLPKIYSRVLGEAVFNYRWFLYVYVLGVYFIGPLILLGIALIPHWIGLAIIGLPLIAIGLFLFIVALLRHFAPNVLPAKLKSFDWLPVGLRSLKPYDNKMKKLRCCRPKKKIVIEHRMSNAGKMEEVYVEKEEAPEFIPNVIRRLSAIDSLVTEARHFSKQNTLDDISSHPSMRRRSTLTGILEKDTELSGLEKSIKDISIFLTCPL
jgi:sodium-dependent phosphate cotransporter